MTKQVCPAGLIFFLLHGYISSFWKRPKSTTVVSAGAAPEAAEEPMETEGGAAVEPAAAAADLPLPATAVASDPAPPPPGRSPPSASFIISRPVLRIRTRDPVPF